MTGRYPATANAGRRSVWENSQIRVEAEVGGVRSERGPTQREGSWLSDFTPKAS